MLISLCHPIYRRDNHPIRPLHTEVSCLSAQFHYFGIHFIPAVKSLFKNGNVEYFNKAIQYLQLPRILTLGILLICTILSACCSLPPHPFLWSSSFLLIIIALIIAVPVSFYKKEFLKAILYLPLGFLFMFLSLLKIKGANEHFIHTKHTYNAFQIRKRK